MSITIVCASFNRFQQHIEHSLAGCSHLAFVDCTLIVNEAFSGKSKREMLSSMFQLLFLRPRLAVGLAGNMLHLPCHMSAPC